MKTKELPIFQSTDARRVLREACEKHGVTPELLRDLIRLQRKYTGERQLGISSEFDSILGEFIEENGDRK